MILAMIAVFIRLVRREAQLMSRADQACRRRLNSRSRRIEARTSAGVVNEQQVPGTLNNDEFAIRKVGCQTPSICHRDIAIAASLSNHCGHNDIREFEAPWGSEQHLHIRCHTSTPLRESGVKAVRDLAHQLLVTGEPITISLRQPRDQRCQAARLTDHPPG